MHKQPNVIRMDQVGVPTYDELVVVARKATVVDQPNVIRRFVQALARGYEAVRKDPQTGVDNLVKANPGLDPAFSWPASRPACPRSSPAIRTIPGDSRAPASGTRTAAGCSTTT